MRGYGMEDIDGKDEQNMNDEPIETKKAARVRRGKLKSDYVTENVILSMRVHQLECELRKFKTMSTMRRIVWAVKGESR